MAAGIATNLITGLASLLHDAGAVTWVPTGVVDTGADPPPVFLGRYPDAPDVAAALTTYYPGGDEPTLSGSVIMLQVRTRSSPNNDTLCGDLDDAIAQGLLGNYPVTLATGVVVSTLIRVSGSPIGPDAAGRLERTTNYRIRLHDPGPHRA